MVVNSELKRDKRKEGSSLNESGKTNMWPHEKERYKIIVYKDMLV